MKRVATAKALRIERAVNKRYERSIKLSNIAAQGGIQSHAQ